MNRQAKKQRHLRSLLEVAWCVYIMWHIWLLRHLQGSCCKRKIGFSKTWFREWYEALRRLRKAGNFWDHRCKSCQTCLDVGHLVKASATAAGWLRQIVNDQVTDNESKADAVSAAFHMGPVAIGWRSISGALGHKGHEKEVSSHACQWNASTFVLFFCWLAWLWHNCTVVHGDWGRNRLWKVVESACVDWDDSSYLNHHVPPYSCARS